MRRGVRQPGRRAYEQLEVMRLLWEDRPDGASYSGEFFEFDHAACYPKPAGRVPDRADRLAALGADRVLLAMPPNADIGEACDLLSACAQRLALTP